MNKYVVQYSKLTQKYSVINSATSAIQSFWRCPVEAARVARDLNAYYNAASAREEQATRPALKVVRHLRLVS